MVVISHFRVHFSLHFKVRLSAKFLLWKSVFIHIEIGTNYHNKNFTLRLTLKERLLKGTQRWPIIIIIILWFTIIIILIIIVFVGQRLSIVLQQSWSKLLFPFFSLLQLVMEFCGAGSITDLVKGMCYFLP